MCFFTEQKANKEKIIARFNKQIVVEDDLIESDFINGFVYPNLPIITNENPDIITTRYTWGLLPSWSKDLDFRKNTLNARIETIDEKASFKNITSNRCLIIASGYYEWRWLDEKGKVKVKYEIHNQENEIFCFAGLFNNGINPENGDVLNTYTMVTTTANDVMQFVHNNKKRMPIMLNKDDEYSWLDSSKKIQDFAFPYSANLIALPTKN
jgi:putative SOS response-associated peptidase YedK